MLGPLAVNSVPPTQSYLWLIILLLLMISDLLTTVSNLESLQMMLN